MKTPSLRLIKPLFDSSFSVKHYSVKDKVFNPNLWHFHPELEIVYVKEGSGMRHVGNHLSYYENGDLVLIGTNLPHTGFTDENTGHKEEVVVHFQNTFIGEAFWELPEMKSISKLLQRSSTGIAFTGDSKYKIGGMLEKLSKQQPFERLLLFLKILENMANAQDTLILNAKNYSVQNNENLNERAADIFQYIKNKYMEQITLDEISSVAAMTVPSFCRYFKNLNDKTFTQFLNEFRIIEACKLLNETDFTIKEIAIRVGFNSIAHFNKHFKLVTSKTPRVYRKDVNNKR
jgi:AraC-like DNA-binding protein